MHFGGDRSKTRIYEFSSNNKIINNYKEEQQFKQLVVFKINTLGCLVTFITLTMLIFDVHKDLLSY